MSEAHLAGSATRSLHVVPRVLACPRLAIGMYSLDMHLQVQLIRTNCDPSDDAKEPMLLESPLD